MSTKPSAKLGRELARPFRQLGRLVYRSASRVYSPFIYDTTQKWKVRVSPGALPLMDHVGIYVIAPFHGVWPSHMVALEYMHQSGVSPIVTSNLPLSASEKALISERCSVVIERPNQGYDFGAYREACLHLSDRLEGLSRLTLFNDSTWFPAPGSRNWFRELNHSVAGLTGATSNFGGSRVVPRKLVKEPWYYGPDGLDFHLQSFALSFSSDVLRNQSFRDFWKKYPLVNDKDLTVARGEIGLSKWAFKQGWPVASTYQIERLNELLMPLSAARLREIAEKTIVLGNPRFVSLKRDVLAATPGEDTLRLFILAAARCLGVSYALPELNLRELRFPFLKKSPIWHQKEASDITLDIIRSYGGEWGIEDEAEYLRRLLLTQ